MGGSHNSKNRWRRVVSLLLYSSVWVVLIGFVFVVFFPDHYARLRAGEVALPGGETLPATEELLSAEEDGGAKLPLPVLKRLHQRMTSSRWPLGAYRWHETIGYELTPGFSAKLLNGSFTTRTHRLGYRIPQSESMTDVDPAGGGILAVGCSFTYADHVEAEESFTNYAGKILERPAHNYGVCSYSYASALLQLEDLAQRGVLKRLRPSAVVLGAGPWLHDRSTNPYIPTGGLQYAYPYIGRDDGGAVTVMPPPPGHSLRHRFDLSKLYFPAGRRDRELTPRRLELLAKVGPTVLAAARARKQWHTDVTTAELYELTISRLEKVATSQPRAIPVVVLWLARNPDEHPTPELERVVKAHPQVSLIDGAQVLQGLSRRQIIRNGHPSVLAHRRFGELLARELGKQH